MEAEAMIPISVHTYTKDIRYSKYVTYSMVWWYKQLALHWARGVYKQNNCVHCAVITTI